MSESILLSRREIISPCSVNVKTRGGIWNYFYLMYMQFGNARKHRFPALTVRGRLTSRVQSGSDYRRPAVFLWGRIYVEAVIHIAEFPPMISPLLGEAIAHLGDIRDYSLPSSGYSDSGFDSMTRTPDLFSQLSARSADRRHASMKETSGPVLTGLKYHWKERKVQF
jgi:hypothetical protein